MNKFSFGKIGDWLQTEKGRKIILIVGLVGLALILLSHFLTPANEVSSVPSGDLDAYTKALEDQMTAIISDMEGVGNCRVMITLENGMEYLYDGDAVLVTEILPTVKGVVVVCEGGDDPTVCARIQNAVTTALHITSKRVCVTKLS